VADKHSRKIICTTFGKGRNHDFKLFKRSKTYIHPSIQCAVDTGYQGISKLHTNTLIPKKKSKKKPLTKADKKQNRQISSQRVVIENVIRELKIFRIIAERYRNRRKKFGLRCNLIAAIYNKNISIK
jgi:hypothetical protein